MFIAECEAECDLVRCGRPDSEGGVADDGARPVVWPPALALPLVPALALALALASALALTLVPFIVDAALPTTPLVCACAPLSARSAVCRAIPAAPSAVSVAVLMSALALTAPEPPAPPEALAPGRLAPMVVAPDAVPLAAPETEPV